MAEVMLGVWWVRLFINTEVILGMWLFVVGEVIGCVMGVVVYSG